MVNLIVRVTHSLTGFHWGKMTVWSLNKHQGRISSLMLNVVNLLPSLAACTSRQHLQRPHKNKKLFAVLYFTGKDNGGDRTHGQPTPLVRCVYVEQQVEWCGILSLLKQWTPLIVKDQCSHLVPKRVTSGIKFVDYCAVFKVKTQIWRKSLNKISNVWVCDNDFTEEWSRKGLKQSLSWRLQ